VSDTGVSKAKPELSIPKRACQRTEGIDSRQRNVLLNSMFVFIHGRSKLHQARADAPCQRMLPVLETTTPLRVVWLHLCRPACWLESLAAAYRGTACCKLTVYKYTFWVVIVHLMDVRPMYRSCQLRY
jgi:hypothetical protein